MEKHNQMDHIKQLIETYGQNDQRTDAWHAKRGEMLTASEISKALPDSTPAMKHELMMSKLTPRPKGDGPGARALIWGTRFEPIAKAIYSALEPGMSIVDTTCIPHPNVSFLGASPDGILITEDTTHPRYGRLVEFKCPISREFTDDTPIPNAYFHQMQLQMECTQLELCEYVEMKFKVLSFSEWSDTVSETKGFFAVHDDDRVTYKDVSDPRSPKEWISAMLDQSEQWELVYWVLEKWRTKDVPHDKEWLQTNLPSMTSIWNTILTHRTNGTFPEHPREKTTLTL